MSIVLTDVHRRHSQFWYFENVCSLPIVVLITRGAAHTERHKEAAIQREEKNRHSQITRIENDDDVYQRMLLI
jgi:hypothetical protein